MTMTFFTGLCIGWFIGGGATLCMLALLQANHWDE
jgi:hypothetical protein